MQPPAGPGTALTTIDVPLTSIELQNLVNQRGMLERRGNPPGDDQVEYLAMTGRLGDHQAAGRQTNSGVAGGNDREDGGNGSGGRGGRQDGRGGGNSDNNGSDQGGDGGSGGGTSTERRYGDWPPDKANTWKDSISERCTSKRG